VDLENLLKKKQQLMRKALQVPSKLG